MISGPEPRNDSPSSGRSNFAQQGCPMLGTILLIILILLLLGAVPTWPHSHGWGYYPSGGLGLILIVVIILPLAGRL
jgi:hypothetical protein